MSGAPEPRRAPRRRQPARADGPTGTIVVGTVTPEFDRHFAAVYYLESKSDGFSIEAAVSPPDIEHNPGHIDVENRPLVWWARDDRGNRYLGALGQLTCRRGSRVRGRSRSHRRWTRLAERLELLPHRDPALAP